MFALGLEKAAALIEDGRIDALVKERYASFAEGKGAEFAAGKMTMESLAALAESYDTVHPASGKQELYENILNEVIFNG